MASIPLILPNVDGGGLPPAPYLDPGRYASLSTSGLRVVAGAASTVAEIAAEHQRIQRTLTDEQDRVDAERAVGQFKIKAQQNEMDVKSDLNIPADQYATQVEERNRRDREAFGKDLKSDRSRRMYERGAEGVQISSTINARAEGFKTQIAGLKVAKADERRQLENQAVFGATEAERNAARLQIETGIDHFLGKGFYSAEEASAARAGSAARIQEGEIRRDIRNPTKRAGVIDGLLMGTYTALPAERQLELAQTLTAEDERRRKDQEAEDEKTRTKQYDLLMSNLYDRADKGTLGEEEFNGLVETHRIKPADQSGIRKLMRMDPNEKERPSTPHVRSSVILDVWGLRPKMTEQQIDALHESWRNGGEGLNTKDYQAAKNRWRETTEGNIRFGQSLAQQARANDLTAHQQGLQLMHVMLGIPPEAEKADPKLKKIWADAFAEYGAASRAHPETGGKMAPHDAAMAVINKYRPILGAGIQLNVQDQRSALRFKSFPELDAALKNGSIGQGEYDNERRKLMEYRKSLEDQKKILQQRVESAPKPPLTSIGPTAPIEPAVKRAQQRNAPTGPGEMGRK